jgi:hypothetical protein
VSESGEMHAVPADQEMPRGHMNEYEEQHGMPSGSAASGEMHAVPADQEMPRGHMNEYEEQHGMPTGWLSARG